MIMSMITYLVDIVCVNFAGFTGFFWVHVIELLHIGQVMGLLGSNCARSHYFVGVFVFSMYSIVVLFFSSLHLHN